MYKDEEVRDTYTSHPAVDENPSAAEERAAHRSSAAQAALCAIIIRLRLIAHSVGEPALSTTLVGFAEDLQDVLDALDELRDRPRR